jgi:uncharacterized protein YoxC
MAAVCPRASSLTDSELNQGFNNGLLPSTPNGSADRDGNGMLTASAVSSILQTLKTSNVIPVATASNAEAYVARQTVFLRNVKAEYCFYDSRYKFCLEKLFSAVRQGYQNNSREAQSLVQKYLELTQRFNQRVNDLTQIMNAITEDGLRASNNINQDIQEFNAKIQEQQKKLTEQRALITSSQATTTIRKQMVKYTEEKARRSDNLLKMYGFLNIVALGLLVYIYRAVPE